MAYIFNDKGIQLFMDRASAYNLGTSVNIFVYQGSQPTIANYESNWTTNYFIDSTTPTFGSDLLCTYGYQNNPSGVTASNFDFTSTVAYPFIWSKTDTSFTSTYVKDGTAAWAVIWTDVANYTTGNASLPGINWDQYIIVPVTNTAGNGVIKLDSVTVSSTAPSLTAFDMKFQNT